MDRKKCTFVALATGALIGVIGYFFFNRKNMGNSSDGSEFSKKKRVDLAVKSIEDNLKDKVIKK